ncbi:SAM-dependent methyltransferase [Parafrankia colletiae]|uniref:SAM-dependent methyltransferase n=1 Tax=Parafrankia colletiae TaxID=573497 RepID=A0A1S1QJJ6_9ACTN|nr:class I SAM-dependent methyltransferase [Parafrankia colletiae]MCK9901990.1 methyltransferase domain-containing protein [Frankia sp. Cpl3]OHV33242.1 SAM-dependent methyltransferase [Parafrankia colletiae]
MPTTQTSPDLAAVTERQQQTWSSGNFAKVASRIVLSSELLADAADLHAGWRVLDVACGTGNAAIAAARAGAHVVGIDYVPQLLADAEARSRAEGLDAEFRVGDIQHLPVPDGSFDAVLSVFGSMFAPDHRRTAAEIVRAARPGGIVGLASWTPDGFVGDMFRVISTFVPPPAGVSSPLLWGTLPHLDDLFGNAIATAESVEQTCTFRFASAEEFVAFFRRWYGPTFKAFEALDPAGRDQLAAELTDLARRWDRYGGSENAVALPSAYLQTVITLR